MTAVEKYANAVRQVLETADTHGKALSYVGMMNKTGLSYGQVAAGLHHIRNHATLINGKPMVRFNVGRQGFYCGAASRDEAAPWVNRQARYGTTLFETLGNVVESIISVYGSDPQWRRLLLDVSRVREDAAFLQEMDSTTPAAVPVAA